MYQCENCGHEYIGTWCENCGYDKGMEGTGYPDMDTMLAEMENDKEK